MVPGMTLAERIERQERANAAANMETYAEYTARKAARFAHYLANAASIDAQIARDDAELDTGDSE